MRGIKSILFIISGEKYHIVLSFVFLIFLPLGNTCKIFESMKVEFMYLYMLHEGFIFIYIGSYIILSPLLSRLLYLCWSLGPIKKNPNI